MAEQWRRVARWAGMGNNRGDSSSTDGSSRESDEKMVEEGTVQENENRSGELASDPQSSVESMDASAESSSDPVSVLRTELEQAQGERDQMRDRLLRLQAEFDNARKREAKERADTRDYAVQGAVEPFLGVMDNFQLALKSGGSAEQLRAGVELILKQMEEALRGLNVQAVEAVGTQFDPRVHEALGSIETPEYPDHQVVEEIRRGYKLRDKLLRPALVKIAVNPSQVSD